MKSTVIGLSLGAVVATLLLGTIGYFIGTFGFDVSNAYNTPYAVAATSAGVATGFVTGLVALGVAVNFALRRHQVGWLIGLAVWPLVVLAASAAMLSGALGYSSAWWIALVVAPLAPLLFGILAPSDAPAADKPSTVAQGRLVAFSAVLGVAAVGGVVVLALGPRPATTSGTPGTYTPPTLQVSLAANTADCATGVFPFVKLTNSGSATVQWTSSSSDSHLSILPSSGSLTSGNSIDIAVSGQTSASSVSVVFQPVNQSASAGAVAKFACQPGSSK